MKVIQVQPDEIKLRNPSIVQLLHITQHEIYMGDLEKCGMVFLKNRDIDPKSQTYTFVRYHSIKRGKSLEMVYLSWLQMMRQTRIQITYDL